MKSLTDFIKEGSNGFPYNATVGKFFQAVCTEWVNEKPASKMRQKDVDPNEWDADQFALFLYGGAPEDADLKDEAKDGNRGAKSIYDNFKTYQKCFDWAKDNLKKKITIYEKDVPNNYSQAYIWSFEVDGMKFEFETQIGWDESDNW